MLWQQDRICYARPMASTFMERSEEYLRQIDAEVERLGQLRAQVQAAIQGEDALEQTKPIKPARKQAAKKSAAKKAPVKKRAARQKAEAPAE